MAFAPVLAWEHILIRTYDKSHGLTFCSCSVIKSPLIKTRRLSIYNLEKRTFLVRVKFNGIIPVRRLYRDIIDIHTGIRFQILYEIGFRSSLPRVGFLWRQLLICTFKRHHIFKAAVYQPAFARIIAFGRRNSRKCRYCKQYR